MSMLPSTLTEALRVHMLRHFQLPKVIAKVALDNEAMDGITCLNIMTSLNFTSLGRPKNILLQLASNHLV